VVEACSAFERDVKCIQSFSIGKPEKKRLFGSLGVGERAIVMLNDS